jgi:hypothetical protein
MILVCKGLDDVFLHHVRPKDDEPLPPLGRVLTHADFITWKHKDIVDKLYYLIDERDLRLLFQDYQYTLTQAGIKYDADSHITYEIIHKSLGEFRSKDMIDLFWLNCDVDKDDVITFTEYVVCRGDFDASANPSVINEYDLRANGMISEYEALLLSGKRMPDLYQYDENGIIID